VKELYVKVEKELYSSIRTVSIKKVVELSGGEKSKRK